MVDEISIGPLKIPGLKIAKGSLLTISLPWPLSMKLEVPPFDIKFWDAFTLLPKITVYDPEWIHSIVEAKAGWIGDIAHGVVDGKIGWIIEKVREALPIPELDPGWVQGIVEGMADWFGDIAHGVLEGSIDWIADSVFNLVEPTLDKMAEEYYATHKKE